MLTQEQKTKIYNLLAEVYLDLIQDGRIGAVEQKVFAQKVLSHIEEAQTFDDVLKFVDEMVTIYPALQIARAKLHDSINKVHETQVMGRLQNFLKGASNGV